MSLQIPLNLKLHKNQQFVHENARKQNVLVCGKRWGKSKLALYRALQKAGQQPNSVVWVVAPSYRQAKQIMWYELMNLLPPQLIRRKVETDLMVELFNGSRFELKGAENEDSLRGAKIHHLVMDEAAYCKEHIWHSILSGQLLGNNGSGTADFISSPNKSGRNWYSSFYEDAKKRMAAGDPEWAAFFFTIWDNETIPVEDIKKLEQNMPTDTWNLEYMAQESEFSGLKYNEFVYDRHVAKLETLTSKFQKYRALDYGIQHPTVCLWAEVDKASGIVHIYDEFCRNGMIIQDICQVIKEKTGPAEISWSVIDPSANRRDMITGRSLKDEFLRCGIGCVDGDRRGADEKGGRGVDIVKMMFKRNMIRIDPRCKNLILELRNLQWGDRDHDDATDALRYLLVRLHDLVFNGTLISPEQAQAPLVAKHTFNLNDSILFPKRELENQSNIRAQLNAY